MGQLKTAIFDVDGVMTTGQFIYSVNGKMYKIFGPHDGDGLKMLSKHINIKFLTADRRGYPITKRRIVHDMEMQLDLVTEDERYGYIESRYGFKNTAYMGDGIFDSKILAACEFSIAPANARKEARQAAKFVTESASAEGAVLDACLEIIKRYFLTTK